MALSIFEHLEDFDNPELSTYDRDEQLRDAVIEYNEQHNTTHDPDRTVKKYKQQHYVQ